MKALSIRQPWAWAILHAGKRIENRAWRAAPTWRGTFLIHAAKGYTLKEYFGAADFMSDVYAAQPWPGQTILPAPQDLDRGAIVGRAKLDGIVRTTTDLAAYLSNAPGVCGAWYTGALGLVLAGVEAIDAPVPFRGALGFFEVPDELLAGRSWAEVRP